jgi:hypothetical protein
MEVGVAMDIGSKTDRIFLTTHRPFAISSSDHGDNQDKIVNRSTVGVSCAPTVTTAIQEAGSVVV